MSKSIKLLKRRMHDCVQSAVSAVKDAREALKYADYRTCGFILDTALASGLEVKYPYVSVYNRRTTLRLTVNCVNGLKEKGLLALIAYLDQLIGSTNSKDYAAGYGASRTFHFGKWEDDLQVIMECDIPEDAKGCRKVAVGEKVETVTQYVIECD